MIMMNSGMSTHHTARFMMSQRPRHFYTGGIHNCGVFIMHGVSRVNEGFPLWSHDMSPELKIPGFFAQKNFFLAIFRNVVSV
jgi:hypothetical protein